MIRYQAKTVADALLDELLRRRRPPLCRGSSSATTAARTLWTPDAAFALLDTVLSLPLDRVSPEDLHAADRLLPPGGWSTVRPAPEGRRRCGCSATC